MPPDPELEPDPLGPVIVLLGSYPEPQSLGLVGSVITLPLDVVGAEISAPCCCPGSAIAFVETAIVAANANEMVRMNITHPPQKLRARIARVRRLGLLLSAVVEIRRHDADSKQRTEPVRESDHASQEAAHDSEKHSGHKEENGLHLHPPKRAHAVTFGVWSTYRAGIKGTIGLRANWIITSSRGHGGRPCLTDRSSVTLAQPAPRSVF